MRKLRLRFRKLGFFFFLKKQLIDHQLIVLTVLKLQHNSRHIHKHHFIQCADEGNLKVDMDIPDNPLARKFTSDSSLLSTEVRHLNDTKQKQGEVSRYL